MRNCLCVLAVYDIVLESCLHACVGLYKLHYITSNITNDNKHLALHKEMNLQMGKYMKKMVRKNK